MKLKLADSWFSKLVRLRDADSNGNVRCISCGGRIFWKEADCGHYIPRRHMATRYDIQNCQPQCMSCNRTKDGNEEGFKYGLAEKYGSEIISELHRLKNQTVKFSQLEINILAEHFRNEAKELMKEKGLK